MSNSFCQKVYDIVRTIPKGKVLTYGGIAKMVGYPRNARLVGYALHNNPDPENIPCHRVVNSQGKISSGFAFGGPNIQREMLENEGIVFDKYGKIDMKKYLLKEN